jgi:hypothetical protein
MLFIASIDHYYFAKRDYHIREIRIQYYFLNRAQYYLIRGILSESDASLNRKIKRK